MGQRRGTEGLKGLREREGGREREVVSDETAHQASNPTYLHLPAQHLRQVHSLPDVEGQAGTTTVSYLFYLNT